MEGKRMTTTGWRSQRVKAIEDEIRNLKEELELLNAPTPPHIGIYIYPTESTTTTMVCLFNSDLGPRVSLEDPATQGKAFSIINSALYKAFEGKS